MDTTPSKLEPRRPAPSRRMRHLHKAFTLVELLVVMVVLAILAGLITGAVIRARITARNAVIKMEITDLATALESYKAEVGEYPPDFVGVNLPVNNPLGVAARARVVAHLRKRFPRYALPPNSEAAFVQFAANLTANYPDLSLANFDASTALVFWLGGLPQVPTGNPSVYGKPAGFHADVQWPFRPGAPRKEPYFEFNAERILVVNTVANVFNPAANPAFGYVPTGLNAAPYVYFKANRNPNNQQYEYGINATQLAFAMVGAGVCVPYLDGMVPPPNNPWRDSNKFQIICAGLDENFGTKVATEPRFTKGDDFVPPALLPSLSPEDMDNITSFAANRLEAELP